MCRAVRFLSLRVHTKALRKHIQLLKHALHGNLILVARHHMLAEVRLHAPANHKDHLAITAFQRIFHGIVHDGFTIRTHLVQLLKSAISAAHTGSKD